MPPSRSRPRPIGFRAPRLDGGLRPWAWRAVDLARRTSKKDDMGSAYFPNPHRLPAGGERGLARHRASPARALLHRLASGRPLRDGYARHVPAQARDASNPCGLRLSQGRSLLVRRRRRARDRSRSSPPCFPIELGRRWRYLATSAVLVSSKTGRLRPRICCFWR